MKIVATIATVIAILTTSASASGIDNVFGIKLGADINTVKILSRDKDGIYTVEAPKPLNRFFDKNTVKEFNGKIYEIGGSSRKDKGSEHYVPFVKVLEKKYGEEGSQHQSKSHNFIKNYNNEVDGYSVGFFEYSTSSLDSTYSFYLVDFNITDVKIENELLAAQEVAKDKDVDSILENF